MSDPTIKERTARLKKRNAERGLVQVQVWIPAARRDDLRDYAAKWRAAWAKGLEDRGVQ